jgi:hypothetical protein
LVLTFRKQIDCWLSPRSSSLNSLLVGSTRCSQSRNGWLGLTTIAFRLMVIILFSAWWPSPSGGLPRIVVQHPAPSARGAGSVRDYQHAIHPR